MGKDFFYLLAGLSFVSLLFALRRKEGIVQFPALFAGAFAFSIVPQMVGHVFFPGSLPDRVYEDNGVGLALLLCVLCLLGGMVGYGGSRNHVPRMAALIPRISLERLFVVGVILHVVGLYGAIRLDSLAGGFRTRFTHGGHYELAWTGLPVIYAYIAKLAPLGLALALNGTLARGTVLRWCVIASMTLYPMANIILLGRRSTTVELVLVFLVSLWFQKRWAPPRVVSIAACMAGGLLIIMMPAYRTQANQTGDVRAAIVEADFQKRLEQYWKAEKGEGMENLIIGVPARMHAGSYGFGFSFWNALVDHFVPGQLVGRSTKDALFVRIMDSDAAIFWEYCGRSVDYGSFRTGPYSAYTEFWFFGCLLYVFIARVFCVLWRLANELRMPGAQALYVATLLNAPMAVVNSLTAAFASFMLSAIIVYVSMAAAEQLVPAPGRHALPAARRRVRQPVPGRRV